MKTLREELLEITVDIICELNRDSILFPEKQEENKERIMRLIDSFSTIQLGE